MLSKAVFQTYCELRDDFPVQGGFDFWLRRDLVVAICRAYLGKGEGVIEVGCGGGTITASLGHALPGIDILAVDCFESQVRKARARVEAANVEIRLLDVTKEPLPDCDMLLLLDVLPYLCGEHEVYAELASGTYVLFSGWNEAYCERYGLKDNRPVERIIEAVPPFMETLLDVDGGELLRMQLLRRKE